MAANKTGNKKHPVSAGLSAIGADIRDIGTTFAEGDAKTRISYLIFGFGPLLRGQIVKGLAFLGCQLAFIWYMVRFGW